MSLFFTYNTKSMVTTLLVMTGRMLPTGTLMSSALCIMVLLEGCVSMEFQNPFQIQQPYP